MDREARVRYITNLDRDRRLKQKEHIACLEALDKDFGIDLDIYTDIYGQQALDGTNEDARTLEFNWRLFLNNLKSPDVRYVAILRTHQKLKPGCYGFGAKPEYETYANMVIVDGEAEVVPIRSAVDGNAKYVLRGSKLMHWSNDQGRIIQTTSLNLATTIDYPMHTFAHEEQRRILGVSSSIRVAQSSVELANLDILNINPHLRFAVSLLDQDDKAQVVAVP